MVLIGMQWTPMHWIPIHSMTPSIPMDGYEYHWNGYLSTPSPAASTRRWTRVTKRAGRSHWVGGKAIRHRERSSVRRRQANDGSTARFRTPIRCVIIGLIAQLLLPEIAAEIPPPETRP